MTRTYFSIAAAGICLAIVLVVASSHYYHPTYLPSDACGLARFRLNQGSQFSNAYHYRDAYNASVLGLKANETCRDEPIKIVNEGFLLSTKAIAGHFLSRRDSSRDLNGAINLLERCREMTLKSGRAVSNICEKQEQSDIETRLQFQTHHISMP